MVYMQHKLISQIARDRLFDIINWSFITNLTSYHRKSDMDLSQSYNVTLTNFENMSLFLYY